MFIYMYHIYVLHLKFLLITCNWNGLEITNLEAVREEREKVVREMNA